MPNAIIVTRHKRDTFSKAHVDKTNLRHQDKIMQRLSSCRSKLKVDLKNILEAASEKGHTKGVQPLVKKGAEVHAQSGPYENARRTYTLQSGLPCAENYITSRKKPDINDPVMLWLKWKRHLSTDWDQLANLVSGGPLACPASGHEVEASPRSLIQRSSRWPISIKRSLVFPSQREPWIWSGHGRLWPYAGQYSHRPIGSRAILTDMTPGAMTWIILGIRGVLFDSSLTLFRSSRMRACIAWDGSAGVKNEC